MASPPPSDFPTFDMPFSARLRSLGLKITGRAPPPPPVLYPGLAQYSEETRSQRWMRGPMTVACSVFGVTLGHIFDRMRMILYMQEYNFTPKDVTCKEAMMRSISYFYGGGLPKLQGWFCNFTRISFPAEAIPFALRVGLFNFLYDGLQLTPRNKFTNMAVGAATGIFSTFLVAPLTQMSHISLLDDKFVSARKIFEAAFPRYNEHKGSLGTKMRYLYKFAGWYSIRGGIEGAIHLPFVIWYVEGSHSPFYMDCIDHELNRRLQENGYMRKRRYKTLSNLGAICAGIVVAASLQLFDIGFYFKMTDSIRTQTSCKLSWMRRMYKVLVKQNYGPIAFMSMYWMIHRYAIMFASMQLIYAYKGIGRENSLVRYY